MTKFDFYDYIISIDIGTTFSGACFSYIEDKQSIIHVVRWPEQRENDHFEKTPTACLYSQAENGSLELRSWGKAAVDYITNNAEQVGTVFMDQFKLKLSHSIIGEKEDALVKMAAIDYLKEIHEYTCTQLIKSVLTKKNMENSPSARAEIMGKTRYVLTIPSTWAPDDSSIMREIALKAGLIDDSKDPEERLIIISEAQAASLYCEREYYNTLSSVDLRRGHRYIVCDAGGGTVDLSTFEYTEPPEYDELKSVKNFGHCQLALESGECCGSIFLDQSMKNYLRDTIFIGCIEEKVLKFLIDQFSKNIKHHFGDDSIKQINFAFDCKDVRFDSNPKATTVATTGSTLMINVKENDHNYEEDYEEDDKDSNNSLFAEDEMLDSTVDEFSCDEFENFTDDEGGDSSEITLPNTDFVYFTLPESGIDEAVLDNLELKGSIIKTNNNIKQLRISHHDIGKYVFDPVVDKVISCIHSQIKKSHTTIDTLFLLGGFGQSPYLYKKIHEEFITSTNTINNLIVPKDGYRASMRGGVFYGIDCVNIVPKYRTKDSSGNFTLPVLFGNYYTLVGIDFNFFNLTANYSFLSLEGMDFQIPGELNSNIESLLKKHVPFNSFSFDYENFFNEHYGLILEKIHQNINLLESSNRSNGNIPGTSSSVSKALDDFIYYEMLFKSFMQQLFEQLKKDFEKQFPQKDWTPETVRYSVSVASNAFPLENNTMKELKAYLSSYLQPRDNFSVDATLQAHSYLLQVIENKPTAVNTLYEYILQSAKAIGMIGQDDSENRIFWCGSRYNSALMHNYILHRYAGELSETTNIFEQLHDVNVKDKYSGYPYRTYSQSIRIMHRSNDTPKNCYMFAFSLLEESSRPFGRVQSITQRGISGGDVQDVINTRRAALKFDQVNQFLSEDDNPTHMSVIDCVDQKGETIQIYEIERLLKYIGRETDFMSKHVRAYVKNKVDLSNLEEKHTIADMFVDDQTNRTHPICAISSTQPAYDLIIEDSILHYKHEQITTKDILKVLIIPWIQNRLTTAIINFCANYCPIDLDRDSRQHSCLIFEDEIVQTKSTGPVDLKNWRDIGIFEGDEEEITASVFLFQFLKAELEKQIEAHMWNINCYSILHDTNPDYSRHIDCLINGLLVPKPEKLRRVVRNEYALHFVKYSGKANHKNSGNGTTEIHDHLSQIDFGSEYSRIDPVVMKVDFDKNHLALYPVLRKDKAILSNFPITTKQFYLEEKNCVIAAALYCSKDMHDMVGDYNISNPLFTKIHRFMIPFNDNNKDPIILSCQAEEYSILFTIKQGDYKADFRYNDILYRQ